MFVWSLKIVSKMIVRHTARHVCDIWILIKWRRGRQTMAEAQPYSPLFSRTRLNGQVSSRDDRSTVYNRYTIMDLLHDECHRIEAVYHLELVKDGI